MCFKSLISLNRSVQVPVVQRALAAGAELVLDAEVTPGSEQAYESWVAGWDL